MPKPGTSAPEPPTTISLIGMPGCGKSTVGVILAKLTGLRFIDTDLDIQVREGGTLQHILEQQGYLRLRSIEQQVLLELQLDGAIIATGGSVVYSTSAMARLQKAGPVVYIEANLDILQQRVAASPARGIASDTEQSYEQIFAERTPLYERYADLTVSTEQGNAEQVAMFIASRLKALA